MSRQFTLPSSVSQVSLPSTGTFSFQILITNLQFSFSKGKLQRSYKAIFCYPILMMLKGMEFTTEFFQKYGTYKMTSCSTFMDFSWLISLDHTSAFKIVKSGRII